MPQISIFWLRLAKATRVAPWREGWTSRVVPDVNLRGGPSTFQLPRKNGISHRFVLPPAVAEKRHEFRSDEQTSGTIGELLVGSGNPCRGNSGYTPVLTAVPPLTGATYQSISCS